MKYYGSQLSDNITETPEGYLICHDTVIARTGMQEYGANEVPVKGNGVVKVFRMVEDVLSTDTLASFEGKPLTAGHPEDFVTPDNWNKLAMGFAKNIRGTQSEDDENLHYIIADVMITNAKAIQAVKDGLRELSCGYEADYVDNGDGTGRQIDIRGNHIALVPQGRCGSACAIKDQSYKGGFMGIKEKVIDALSAIFDDATIDADKADIAKEEETKDIEETPEEEKQEAVTISALAEKLDALSAKLDTLIGMEKSEAEGETAEAEESEEETEDKKDTCDADTISRAEILAPGIVKNGDVKQNALDAFGLTAEGQSVLSFLNGLTGDSLFVAASELMKLKRAESFKPHGTADNAYIGAPTIADINAKHEAHWAKQK